MPLLYVIEDDGGIRHLLTIALENCGYADFAEVPESFADRRRVPHGGAPCEEIIKQRSAEYSENNAAFDVELAEHGNKYNTQERRQRRRRYAPLSQVGERYERVSVGDDDTRRFKPEQGDKKSYSRRNGLFEAFRQSGGYFVS